MGCLVVMASCKLSTKAVLLVLLGGVKQVMEAVCKPFTNIMKLR